MADSYFVGNKSGGKDRYMVGWNESKSNASAYKVGNSKSGPSQSSKSVGGDQDSVVGGKSAFSYSEPDVKDPGDKSKNMNFGGEISNGIQSMKATGPGGDVMLSYSEKGDWSDSKNAMARRKANMEAYGKGDGYTSPTVDLVSIKK